MFNFRSVSHYSCYHLLLLYIAVLYILNLCFRFVALRYINTLIIQFYFSVIVYSPIQRQCTSPLTLQATTRGQHLSSVISEETKCGLHQAPYILEAKAGQQIKITLTDFSTNDDRDNVGCPIKFGYILDTKDDDVINLCGGSKSEGQIYTSVSNNVQVLLEQSAVQSHPFIIQFKGICIIKAL